MGGAVRRLHQRRAGDRGPVPVGGALQVGAHHATHAPAAARIRGPGTGALQRPAGALPPARRRGQHPGRQPHHAGAVLPSAPPAGAADPPASAGGHDTQEPAPAAPGQLAAGGSRHGHLAAGARRPGHAGRCRAAPSGWSSAPARSTTTCWPRPRRWAKARPAIVRLEQLYSFPWTELRAVLDRYQKLESWSGSRRSRATWAPGPTSSRSFGSLPRRAWTWCYVGRPERASPAEGYPAAHAAEQSRIIREALAAGERGGPDPLHTVAAAGEPRGEMLEGGWKSRPLSSAPSPSLFVEDRPFRRLRASSLRGSERCSP